MIDTTQQNWKVGEKVNVGFLKGLLVERIELTPGDYKPDAYILSRGAALYRFVPHNGIQRIN